MLQHAREGIVRGCTAKQLLTFDWSWYNHSYTTCNL